MAYKYYPKLFSLKMRLTLLLLISFIALLLAFKDSKLFNKPERIFKLNKKNFYTWMNFSKKERYELSKKDSVFYLNQRKNLLKQIRNEYKNISGSEK